MDKTLLVIGATGDVGQGIVAASLLRGWRVCAAGRSGGRLDELASKHPEICTIAGDVGNAEAAGKLMGDAKARLGSLNAVVISVNAPASFQPIFENDEASLVDLFRSNVISHFHAAKAALDVLENEGVLLGIGGGMADWVPKGGAHLSMVQAALRNFYRGVAKEFPERIIRQMQIASMVNGESKRAIAQDSWLTDLDCGQHVCAILDRPDAFKGPVVVLKSRERVGAPDD